LNRYLVRRLLFLPLTMLGVVTIAFFVLRILPGDAATPQLAGSEQAVRQVDIDALRQKLGLDRPLAELYVTWVVKARRLDFGTSLRTGSPIANDIARRFPCRSGSERNQTASNEWNETCASTCRSWQEHDERYCTVPVTAAS
jgi:ABC-type dipeptide/oligopeptide/nickel transport system permease component